MRNRRASVVFVLITLFIDILGMGLVIPILPRLVQSLLGGAIGEASLVYGLLVSIYAVMQFVCAPILGALFAAAAAWYRRFLRLSSPNRARQASSTTRRGDGRSRASTTSQKVGVRR